MAASAESVTANSILPVLIEVFAGFSKLDGDVAVEEIDSSLGYLRYDYPDAIYSELRRLYFEALQMPQDLSTRAKELGRTLSTDQKLLLAIQLYLLISQTHPPAAALNPGGKNSNRRQMVEFYLFTTNLGIASQAIDIVYQLTAEDQRTPEEASMRSATPVMEVLGIGAAAPADVLLRSLSAGCVVTAYRFQNLILLKNTGTMPVLVRSRRLVPGDFSRLYPTERVVLEDVTLDFQDLVSYFNAKKTLSGTQLYLTLTDDGDAEISPQRVRGAQLRLSFGLGVTIEALRDAKAFINGVELISGTKVDASIEDNIVLDKGEVEIALQDLRRRAREFGGQFRLEGSRNTYLVSNNPDLLDEGDILLSGDTEGELQLRIECDYSEKTGLLEVLKSTRPISVRGMVVKDKIQLEDGDTIILGEGQFLRCHFADRIIEEERNVIRHLEVRELQHRFDSKDTALDGISLSARRGEMICVMGPSGCGKSTFLRALGGQLRPRGGEILLNGVTLYDHLQQLKPYVSYIPQEDAFDPLLKVQENLDCSVAVRCPHLRVEDRRRRVEAKLAELGLAEIRRRLAGTPQQKFLSGGERKRLNAGLDMIGISDIYLFDEPTSGLSSKDSEHVLGIIRSLASNKIVFASIHQPSMKLLDMFDKALLLDKGGKVAFFGTPAQMLHYFWRVYNEETGKVGAEVTELPPNVTPDFVFDVLETPLRDISGDIIIEQNAEGHAVHARRFPPNFWRDRYQTYRLLESVSLATGATGHGQPSSSTTSTRLRSSPDATVESRRVAQAVPEPPKLKTREELVLFATLLKRAFLSKLRNEGNVLTTLLEAPALALLISLVLRYSEEDSYTFASAFHVPTYLFLTLVVAMFLGLTNSADEVIRDRAMLNRERNHNLRPGYYIAGKLISLATFALIQCVIYLWIGNHVLELRDMFGIHLFWMFLTAFTGSCLGMFVSSLVADTRTALNIIPLLLIPQIILGGALIKYEEMNRNLDFVYSIHRYIKPEEEGGTDYSTLKVPFICEFMPLRWSYEAMLISQDKLNPLTRSQDVLDARIQAIIDAVPDGELDNIQKHNLDLSKQALAVVSGLRAQDSDDLAERLHLVVKKASLGELSTEVLEQVQMEKRGYSAEDLYVNQKVHDLITKAEMEREDYRRVKSPNVFFGTKKRIPWLLHEKQKGWHWGEQEISTLSINAFIMLVSLCLIVTGLYYHLRRQLTRL